MKVINSGYTEDELKPTGATGKCMHCLCEFKLTTDEELISMVAKWSESHGRVVYYYECPNCTASVAMRVQESEMVTRGRPYMQCWRPHK